MMECRYARLLVNYVKLKVFYSVTENIVFFIEILGTGFCVSCSIRIKQKISQVKIVCSQDKVKYVYKPKNICANKDVIK